MDAALRSIYSPRVIPGDDAPLVMCNYPRASQQAAGDDHTWPGRKRSGARELGTRNVIIIILIQEELLRPMGLRNVVNGCFFVGHHIQQAGGL